MECLFWMCADGSLYGLSHGGPDADGNVEIFCEDGKKRRINIKKGWQIITPELLLGEMGRRKVKCEPPSIEYVDW